MDPSHRYQALLQLLDLSPQSHSTCIGTAKSTNQCRCAVALQSRNQAAQVLSTVARSRLTIESIKEKMGLVAKLLLCKRFHQNQSTDLSSVWTDTLRSSRFTTHTATLHAALDEGNGSWGAGQDNQYLRRGHVVYEPREMLDPPIASTEASELSVGTTRYQDLLQLLDLSPQSHSTCIGTAKSTNQQCRCRVALQSRNQAVQVLSTVAIASLTIESMKEDMELVAKLLLCKRFHQDQSARLSSVWTDRLRSSRITIHTATLRAARDRNSGSRGAGQQDLVTASTEAPDLSVRTTTPRARRRRAPDTPFSMTLHSASVTRDSHQECPICMDEYGPRDHTVISCGQCQNIYHRDCAGEWRREHNTCPLCRRHNTLVERTRNIPISEDSDSVPTISRSSTSGSDSILEAVAASPSALVAVTSVTRSRPTRTPGRAD